MLQSWESPATPCVRECSPTAAAGEEVEQEEVLRSLEVSPLSVGRETPKDNRGERGCRSACPDKWLHFSHAIANVLTR